MSDKNPKHGELWFGFAHGFHVKILDVEGDSVTYRIVDGGYKNKKGVSRVVPGTVVVLDRSAFNERFTQV